MALKYEKMDGTYITKLEGKAGLFFRTLKKNSREKNSRNSKTQAIFFPKTQQNDPKTQLFGNFYVSSFQQDFFN